MEKQKKTLTTEKIVLCYNALKEAKLTKMEDSEKIAVIRIMRVFKPIATELTEFINDSREKLKPVDFERIEELISRQQTGAKLSDEESKEVNGVQAKYTEQVEKCISEAIAKENELEYEVLSDAAFGRFMASNDMPVAQLLNLEEVLC